MARRASALTPRRVKTHASHPGAGPPLGGLGENMARPSRFAGVVLGLGGTVQAPAQKEQPCDLMA